MNPNWQPYLDPDESLLWQGTPVTGLRFPPKAALTSFGGLFLLGFALFWTLGAGAGILSGAWRSEGTGMRVFMVIFPLFGLPFVALGVYLVIGHYFHDAKRRRQTRYALTNRRALIAYHGRPFSLRSWPILPDTMLDYAPGPEASISFATELQVDSEGDKSYSRIGFDRITEGDAVYRLIRKIQRGEA